MVQYFQQWQDSFDAFSLRERALVTIVVFVIIVMAWDAALMKNLYKQRDDATEKIKKSKQQISEIDRRTLEIVSRLGNKNDTQALQRIEELKNTLNSLNQKQKKLAVKFIRPRQMAHVLKGLLKQEAGLKLTRLESIGVQPLVFPSIGKPGAQDDFEQVVKLFKEGKATHHLTLPETDAARNEQIVTDGATTPKRPDIYKHAVEIEFIGDYLSTLNYLRNLEALPWHFYWDGMEYKVIKHPKATITISIYTLSLDKSWIGV